MQYTHGVMKCDYHDAALSLPWIQNSKHLWKLQRTAGTIARVDYMASSMHNPLKGVGSQTW